MKFRFIVKGVVLFESDGGDLTISKAVLDIGGGFGNGNFEAVAFRIRDDVAELSFEETPDIGGLNAKERKFIVDRKPIMAIKELRDRRKISLKEAKDIVDTYRTKHSNEPWGLAP